MNQQTKMPRRVFRQVIPRKYSDLFDKIMKIDSETRKEATIKMLEKLAKEHAEQP